MSRAPVETTPAAVLRRTFAARFGDAREPAVFFAPGRVNLIGDHTDYNGGHVLPCALRVGTYAVAAARDDRRVRLLSLNFAADGVVEADLDALERDPAHGWADYPKAMLRTMADAGFALEQGLDIAFGGDLPAGVGLSSSASIEVLTGWIVRHFGGFTGLSARAVALLAHRAETGFIGVHCGVMDPFAVALCQPGHAMLLDCRHLSLRHVALPLHGVRLLVANSHKRRALTESPYNARAAECARALRLLQRACPIGALCELDEPTLETHAVQLPAAQLLRRARHAVSENRRVLCACDALEQGDLPGFGALMNASHRSLARDFAVTGRELDALVEAAWDAPGCLGARMTGAGFGGCSVNLVRAAEVDAFVDRVRRAYADATGLDVTFLPVDAAAGDVAGAVVGHAAGH